MGVSTGIMMALSTGLSVVGQIQQGNANAASANQNAANADAQAAQLDRQAELDRIQAQRETVAATEEAKRIRKAGDKQAAASRAALAASGIMVDQGSSININEDITGGAESDAMNTLLTGERKAKAYTTSADETNRSAGNARSQASQYRSAASSAKTSSLLSAGATALTGWRGVKTTNDPIGDFYKRGTRGAGD